MIARLRLILGCKKGLTLVEVIVASAISSIILVAALGFFLPTTQNMKRIDDLNDAKMVSQMIISGIEKQVKYAVSVTIDEEAALTPPVLGNNMLYQQVDATDPTLTMLYFTPDAGVTTAPIVEKGFYGNIRCDTTFSVSSSGNLKVEVKAHLKNSTAPIIVTEAIVISYNGKSKFETGGAGAPLTSGNFLKILPIT